VLLKNIIQRKVGKSVQLIDAATLVSDNLVEFLEKQPDISNRLGKNKMLRLMFSDVTSQIEKAVQEIMKKKVKLELI
jgi:glutamate racemase